MSAAAAPLEEAASADPAIVTAMLQSGLGLVADGTGILLNNELDDFAAKPDAPNAYGLSAARLGVVKK